MRTEIRQLGSELINSASIAGNPVVGAPPAVFGTLQRAVLIHRGFQIDALLLGGIERIFFGLQLRLQASQNLQIAPTCAGSRPIVVL